MGLFDTRDNLRILPGGTTTSGYGGQTFLSVGAAENSYFPDSGQYTDPVTGRVGTARQILDSYRAEGRDITGLRDRLGLR